MYCAVIMHVFLRIYIYILRIIIILHRFGQTGSGKTFTMSGSTERNGLVQLMIRRIIERSSKASNVESITVMLVEDYNTDMYDLLATSKKSLPIHFDHNHGLQMRGVTKTTYSNLKDTMNIDTLVEEVLELYKSGLDKYIYIII